MAAPEETTRRIAVVMEREEIGDRWGSVRWEAHGVVPDPDGVLEERVLHDDGRCRQILFPGFELALHLDEAEDYHFNLTSPSPRVFVLWRLEDDVGRPALVTVAYGAAARMMDGGETVDGVALPPDLYAWVGEFVERNFRPKPKFKRERRR